jgi:hypothetical protein
MPGHAPSSKLELDGAFMLHDVNEQLTDLPAC